MRRVRMAEFAVVIARGGSHLLSSIRSVGAYWQENNFGRWMTNSSSGSINSVQNGILLRSDIYQQFDVFSFSDVRNG